MTRNPIINTNRYQRIICLAEDTGIFNEFRLAKPINPFSLWFYYELYKFTKEKCDLKLYENNVNKIDWSENDQKEGIPLYYYLALYEETNNNLYRDLIRTSIENLLYSNK